jgi:hypothetical protein
MQNFAPWGFPAEQFWQRIDLPVDQATRPSCITRHREEAAGVQTPAGPGDQLDMHRCGEFYHKFLEKLA